MTKILTAALATTLALAMPAFAQTATDHATNPPKSTVIQTTTTTGVAVNHLMPGQIRVTEMNGATVYDPTDHNIGDVKDIILDRDGRVAAVVLDVGSFLGVGGKYVAIPMNEMKVTFKNNNKPRFTVNMTKDQLKSAQAFELSTGERTSTGTSTPPANQRPASQR